MTVSAARARDDAPTPSLAAGATPMMAQYLALKAAHPGCLLFFRMGDFYELFFEDAHAAAQVLGIAVSHRGRHEGRDIPMAGVPAHAHESYLERLIAHGHRVAICEQTEDPAEARARRGRKSVVAREIVRIVTPGTVTEEGLLEPRSPNHLTALAEAGGALGLAWADLSTGAFGTEAPPDVPALAAALARLDPAELLLPERLASRPELFETLAAWKRRLTIEPDPRFDSAAGERRLCARFAVATLDGFGRFTRPELAAAGALVAYIDQTQRSGAARLEAPRKLARGAVLEIDAATRRNLDLTRGPDGGRAGSLLAAIDRTVTGGGARLLAAWLAAPLTDPAAIARRHDRVESLLAPDLREAVRAELARVPDLERARSRLALGRGTPRDLAAMREALQAGAALHLLCAAGPPALRGLVPDPAPLAPLADRLARALADPAPARLADGRVIADGYCPELDRARALAEDGRRAIAALQAELAATTGLAGLKIKHNAVLGYFVELPAAQGERLLRGPQAAGFTHRQTMAGAMRFRTEALAALERELGEAADRATALEAAHWQTLLAEVAAQGESLSSLAAGLAALDVACGLAELATTRHWVRPVLTDDTSFRIQGGRHPVVEAALPPGTPFVPNECDLSPERRLWLVTGPNMAGKSTFLRQAALIAILAQAGSFVPARAARLGIVDRLFSRVGAADDLARGRSTFMVEMVETAAILNQATPRSLVILDEIGRGTATFDGLSLAWAVLEHLHDATGCRGLFATHYHELTQLARRLPNLYLATLRVREWEGRIVFLHEVGAGAADRSYGLHVARLAGLPAGIVARAEQVLGHLEASREGGALTRLAEDLPLFRTRAPEPAPAASPAPSDLERRLRDLEVDALTPRAAHELLYELVALARGRP